jgi:hypothetical protein
MGQAREHAPHLVLEREEPRPFEIEILEKIAR